MIYIVVVNYHSSACVQTLLASLPDPASSDYRIIIVNNSPTDREIYDCTSSKVQILESHSNLGFGAACNLGIQHVFQQDPRGIIWLLNPDTWFPANPPADYWQLIQTLWQQNPHLSLLGTVILTPEESVWFAGGQFQSALGRIISLTDPVTLRDPITPCDWLSGCSLMINLGKFSHCPHFDREYFLYYEDFDFCFRYQRQGHQIAITNQLKIIHQVSAITDQNQPLKIYHSSYSYLLTLSRYTKFPAFQLNLLKFILNSSLKRITVPAIGKAKLRGFSQFLHSKYFSK